LGSRIKQLDLENKNINFHDILENVYRSKLKSFDLENKNINFHDILEKLDRKELKHFGIGVRRFVYITGALVVENRYPTPMVTDFSFDYKRSLKCLEQTVETFSCKPRTVICDGGGCHRKAVKMLLPDVELYTRTKAQCYNIVNHDESYWNEIKDECLHPYRFMSLETVSLAVEFKRFEHIYLRPHSSLKGKTPAESIGIRIPKSITRNENEKWQKILKFAYNVIMMEKCGDLRKFF
jgi:hypothetical protein